MVKSSRDSHVATLRSPCKTPCVSTETWFNFSFRDGQLEQWQEFTLQHCHKRDCHFTTVGVLGGVDVWVVHPSQARGIVLSWCYCVGHDPFIQVRLIWHYCIISGVIPSCAILILGSFVCFVIEYTERVYAVITTCLLKETGVSRKPRKCVSLPNKD